MNVLYLINYAGEGGAEKYVLDLAGHLPGGQAFFVYNVEGRLCSRMNVLGVTSAQVSMRHPFDGRAIKRVARYCEKWEIDLIHTQFQRENYIALLVKRRLKKRRPQLKVVYTSHINLKNNFLWKIMNRFIGRGDDAVIAVCGEGKRLLIENQMPARKITLIPNGVSLDKPFSTGQSQVRGEFGIPEDAFLFVSLTRFTPEKGTAFLLRAVKRLTEKTDRPFRLLLAGEGPLFPALREAAVAYGLKAHVIFAGYRDDPDNLLAEAQAFVNSSESEAASLAILEAMGRGLPVVATAVGGNVEILCPENDCGLLIPYGDEEGLAQAMKRLMEEPDLAADMGRNARRAVEERFTIEKTRADTFSVYQKIRGEKSSFAEAVRMT